MSHRRVRVSLKLPFLFCAWDCPFSHLVLQLCVCCSGSCLSSLTSSVMWMQNLLVVPILTLSSAFPISPADTDAIYLAGCSALSCLCSAPSVQPKTQSGTPTCCKCHLGRQVIWSKHSFLLSSRSSLLSLSLGGHLLNLLLLPKG